MPRSIRALHREIVACRKCPRLVQWRETIAATKVKRFADETYWGKPVPGFGDPRARILIVGLAPAAHGANRTGRMFTGDESGHWLYRALHKAGLAFSPHSTGRSDGQTLTDCYITAACRCAPPKNKPLPEEIAACQPFFLTELLLLRNVRVIIGLGKIGFEAAFRGAVAAGKTSLTRLPKFSHGANVSLSPNLTLIGSYHPSQQNTFTGVLTERMFDAIFRKTITLL